jgi:hypothetical protein
MGAAEARELWASADVGRWQEALDDYARVVDAQEIAGLAELDRWYRDELPAEIATRNPPYLDRSELSDIARWKMMRGEWRQRNLMLVRSNRDVEIREATQEAFVLAPDPKTPVVRIAKLAGVGAATASAALAPYRPDLYPFLDEVIGAAIPGLEETKFTVPYYVRYAEALRQRATDLGEGWTAQQVGLALWSASGGKAAQ